MASVGHCHPLLSQMKLPPINGDGTLLDPISLSVILEMTIPTPTPGAPIESLENEKESKVVVGMLGETEATLCNYTLVVIPADMENAI